MKISEIKDMTQVELAAKGRDLRQEMFNLRLQQASAQLEKPRGCARCVATSRGSKPVRPNSATARKRLNLILVWLKL